MHGIGWCCFAASLLFTSCVEAAQTTYEVDSVEALTNVLTQMKTGKYYPNTLIKLKPKVYDLTGVYMSAESHLEVKLDAWGTWFLGQGAKPGDVVLKGDGTHRVLYFGYGSDSYLNVISNLTITGGYTTGSGGGVWQKAFYPSLFVYDSIVSNNVSTAKGQYDGGGGIYCGSAIRTLFVDNKSANAGGAIHCGGSGKSTKLNANPYVKECVFVNNQQTDTYGKDYGGGAVSCGSCYDSWFTNNVGKTGGAVGVSVYSNPATISNCVFSGNSASSGGGALYKPAAVVDCEFDGNKASGSAEDGQIYTASRMSVNHCSFTGACAGNYGAIAHDLNLVDCTIVGCTVTRPRAIWNCNLVRCRVAGNTVDSDNNGYDFDIWTEGAACTNVNCVFSLNHVTTYGAICKGKTLINCTIVSNQVEKSNYARVIDNCPMFNTVLQGNRIGESYYDIRTKPSLKVYQPPVCTNCVFTAADVAADAEGMFECRKVKSVRFVNCDWAGGIVDVKRNANLLGRAFAPDWLLSVVGDTDVNGNPRICRDALDIGAVEYQYPNIGLMLLFR